MAKTLTRSQQAVVLVRSQLRQAIDRACIARGEAQWTNGYRTAKFAGHVEGPEEERLYQKELAQFRLCGTAEARVERLMCEFARVVRRDHWGAARTPSRGRSKGTSAPRKVRRA